jgi:hypothetical protein
MGGFGMYYEGGHALPMYGETSWGGNYTVNMIRAVAKVQVKMGDNVSDVTGNFNAETVRWRIYNEGMTGKIQPSAGLQGFPQAGFDGTEPYRLLQKADATERQTNVYIHEYPSRTQACNSPTPSLNEKTWDAYRVFILLEHEATGLFYRLDFFSDSIYLDIKRNNHYIFTINKIRSVGYSSDGEAMHNPGSNIEYTVKVSDDMTHITSNGQYAIASNVDTAYIPATIGEHIIGSIRYIDPTPGVNVTYSVIATGSIGLGNPTPSSLTSSNQYIKVNKSNTTTGEGKVIFTLGNITHTIYVKAL